MKGLSQFIAFDWDSFAYGKTFVVTGTSEYADYETKKHLGTRVDVVIAADKTPYEFKNGNSFTNKYEKLSFKVGKDVSIPIEARVMPKGVKARVYGDFHNQLSIVCEDIAVATAQASAPASAKKEI